MAGPEEAPAVLASVLEALPVAAALFTAEEEPQLVLGNDKFWRMLGSTPQPGLRLGEVFTGREQGRVREVFARVRSEGEAEGLFAPQREDPKSQTVEIPVWNLDVHPVRTAERITHLLAIAHQTFESLSSRQHQERQAVKLRERADQLADLEKTKSEFLNLASHELRGPAAMLRGYLSMLEDGSLGPLPASVRTVLPMLKSKAEQVSMLANEMVEAARLEDKRLQLKLRRLDLGELVKQVVESARANAGRSHDMIYEMRTREPVIVEADRMRLEIIIGNLVDNAIKYSPGGGEIYISLTTAGDLALVTVRDHGIGIEPADMERLFVRFSRLAGERLPDVPGTGLGLYLARELARLHGGDIMAISKFGEGSEFTLSLPRVTSQHR